MYLGMSYLRAVTFANDYIDGHLIMPILVGAASGAPVRVRSGLQSFQS